MMTSILAYQRNKFLTCIKNFIGNFISFEKYAFTFYTLKLSLAAFVIMLCYSRNPKRKCASHETMV